MTVVELIERKRDGGALTEEEIRWLIFAYTKGDATDYQMAAMLMAIFLNGLGDEELAAWTDAMLHSGSILDFSHLPAPKVDKHSTGGVGDKVSIPLAPMVAACGLAVPMMSGRGLGHTGGTLDKLESIPGFTTRLDPDRFSAVLDQCGLVLGGQSDTLVPADRKLYALRDATGTVPSIPLISSSIMSKKLAEGLDGLVLDIKVGAGAFMKSVEEAAELARTMAGIGARSGTRVVAVLTGMDQPLGREVGNSSEIAESIDVLRGQGPDDLTELVELLGAEMLIMGGLADSIDQAREVLREAVTSGRAAAKLAEVIAAQDGDPNVLDQKDLLPRAGNVHHVTAQSSGIVAHCDALQIGLAAVRLGAGRERKEDEIDAAVGITLSKKVGESVESGETLAHVHWNDDQRLEASLPHLEQAWQIGDQAATPQLVLGRITSEDQP